MNPFLNPDFLIAAGALALVLLAGAVAFYFADRWKRQQLSDDHTTAESLTDYRRMFDRGELSRDEYERIRDRLAAELKGGGPITGTVALDRPPTGGGPDTEGMPGSDSEHGNDSDEAPDQEPPRT